MTPTEDQVQRMVQLIRDMTEPDALFDRPGAFATEARAIVATLPKPVDVDMLAAVELDNGKIAPPPSEPMDPQEQRRLIAELTEKLRAEHAAHARKGEW